MSKVYHQVKERELKRLHEAIRTAVNDLLSGKYSQMEESQYRDYLKICAFVEKSLQLIDLVVDRVSPLFEETGARTNWEIYLSGLRRLFQALPDSYLFQSVLSMFKLEDIKEKVLSYSTKWLEESHFAQKALSGVEEYLRSLEKGEEILAKYQAENRELARLYASLGAWETKKDFDRFLADFKAFLDGSIEVFVSGPVQLYLMISREGFLLIFKALSVGKIGELLENGQKYQEIMALHDLIYSLIQDSRTLKVLQEVLRAAAGEYLRLLREEHQNMRRQLPTKELKRRFKERFERGLLFQEEE